MLDLVLGALLVGLGIRGWMRGLVKEVISLAVLVVGTILAFRLSTPLGRVLAAMSARRPRTVERPARSAGSVFHGSRASYVRSAWATCPFKASRPSRKKPASASWPRMKSLYRSRPVSTPSKRSVSPSCVSIATARLPV